MAENKMSLDPQSLSDPNEPETLSLYLAWVTAHYFFTVKRNGAEKLVSTLSEKILKHVAQHHRTRIENEFATGSKRRAAAMIALLQEAAENGHVKKNFFPYTGKITLRSRTEKLSALPS